MNEFIENFQVFKDFLYSERGHVDGDRAEELEDIIERFEELNLNKAF